MKFLNLAWFHVAIEPPIYRLEGYIELFCELNLTEFVFETIGAELVD